jgi:hypothetical protein
MLAARHQSMDTDLAIYRYPAAGRGHTIEHQQAAVRRRRRYRTRTGLRHDPIAAGDERAARAGVGSETADTP